MQKPLILKNLDEVMEVLGQIKRMDEIAIQGDWGLDQNLAHCAHSIEFAMSGYPVEKSRFFQHTVGTLVFHYFDSKGFMRHSTNEFIPGEAPIPVEKNVDGLDALETVIRKFDVWDKPLYPHRFYGRLTKKQYARAHVLHICNHLELINNL
ncbi:MAG: DUF1569 domain-containing protein [Saprospiraceae bacterium]|nr:DUF1569 domain-containing protein [Saprospiraceae bacterium]